MQPEPERLGPEVNHLHEKYIDLVERIFARCFAKLGQKGTPGIKMSVCLEGMLTAFTSYWSEPLQSDNLAKVARHMRTVLLRGSFRRIIGRGRGSGIAGDLHQPL